jgi:vacuolar-type H+-ATPase subunit C/Vma6
MAIFHALEQLSYNNRNLVRRIIQAETDVENFLIAAKLRGKREEIIHTDEMFPSTFNIGLEKLKDSMEAKDVKPVIQSLDSPYNEILAPLYEGDVALIRSRLRRHIYEIAKRGRETNDFGFNAIMAYLVFSEIEKDDLVGISWGKTQGISSEDIIKYLAI